MMELVSNSCVKEKHEHQIIGQKMLRNSATLVECLRLSNSEMRSQCSHNTTQRVPQELKTNHTKTSTREIIRACTRHSTEALCYHRRGGPLLVLLIRLMCSFPSQFQFVRCWWSTHRICNRTSGTMLILFII